VTRCRRGLPLLCVCVYVCVVCVYVCTGERGQGSVDAKEENGRKGRRGGERQGEPKR
jgi:hypothetical protein